ncbi:Rieske (2Fe-2S) protein [Sedimenticola hydrogenitrophicus]|uniref:Rieske (2Fe-2S) protein n=1 Tax=Sedimenticola hydrogenitrophicus TaxID=2967975 RepID=UPI0021A422F5|nr:Rieske (2Fe-2S) protein [Sedimenticola hydrogenitrophicus]
MKDGKSDFILACTLEELEAKGRLLVTGRHRPVLIVHDRGQVFALDNRCPHMGFPLDRGSVEDGILTCHWHHARFDLSSGCTFDLWADDVPNCPVEVRGAEVWVKPAFGYPDPTAHWRRRLDDGMAHNLGLVIAKAIRGLLAAGVAPVDILRQAALFGARNRDGWGTGMTILTALGNLLPLLPEEETCLALFHGVRRVAGDCTDRAPRRDPAPMTSMPETTQLKRWLRRWNAVRHRSGAERTVHTAIAAGTSATALADLLFTAETDRIFADGGHSLDFINKAFECLDLIGWEHAAAVLPTVIGQMVVARGAEESPEWRQPTDLVLLLESAANELKTSELQTWAAMKRDQAPWHHHAALAQTLLDAEPAGIVDALKAAIRAGATGTDLGRALAYAAALRIARFGISNEHGDWETAHHAFTYCHALHQAIKRIEAGANDATTHPEVVRGLFHGAMAVYLTRYLNVPPAALPGEHGNRLDDLPTEPSTLLTQLLDSFDRQRQVDAAARLVARYLLLGHPPDPLIVTLSRALLREDAGFHAYQLLEAGVRQFQEWGNHDTGRHILVAVVRYLAAHSPTERANYQTTEIARRLLGGRALHE